MENKQNVISYIFATLASLCLVSGLLVITGGEDEHVQSRRDSSHDRRSAEH